MEREERAVLFPRWAMNSVHILRFPNTWVLFRAPPPPRHLSRAYGQPESLPRDACPTLAAKCNNRQPSRKRRINDVLAVVPPSVARPRCRNSILSIILDYRPTFAHCSYGKISHSSPHGVRLISRSLSELPISNFCSVPGIRSYPSPFPMLRGQDATKSSRTPSSHAFFHPCKAGS